MTTNSPLCKLCGKPKEEHNNWDGHSYCNYDMRDYSEYTPQPQVSNNSQQSSQRGADEVKDIPLNSPADINSPDAQARKSATSSLDKHPLKSPRKNVEKVTQQGKNGVSVTEEPVTYSGENVPLSEKRIKEIDVNNKKIYFEEDVRSAVRRLKDWINRETGEGKYFMSLGIDKLNEKINEIFGTQLTQGGEDETN